MQANAANDAIANIPGKCNIIFPQIKTIMDNTYTKKRRALGPLPTPSGIVGMAGKLKEKYEVAVTSVITETFNDQSSSMSDTLFEYREAVDDDVQEEDRQPLRLNFNRGGISYDTNWEKARVLETAVNDSLPEGEKTPISTSFDACLAIDSQELVKKIVEVATAKPSNPKNDTYLAPKKDPGPEINKTEGVRGRILEKKVNTATFTIHDQVEKVVEAKKQTIKTKPDIKTEAKPEPATPKDPKPQEDMKPQSEPKQQQDPEVKLKSILKPPKNDPGLTRTLGPKDDDSLVTQSYLEDLTQDVLDLKPSEMESIIRTRLGTSNVSTQTMSGGESTGKVRRKMRYVQKVPDADQNAAPYCSMQYGLYLLNFFQTAVFLMRVYCFAKVEKTFTMVTTSDKNIAQVVDGISFNWFFLILCFGSIQLGIMFGVSHRNKAWLVITLLLHPVVVIGSSAMIYQFYQLRGALEETMEIDMALGLAGLDICIYLFECLLLVGFWRDLRKAGMTNQVSGDAILLSWLMPT